MRPVLRPRRAGGRRSNSTVHGPNMKARHFVIAAAQMKFRRPISDNVAFIVETIRTSACSGADAILFPECAVTGYNCDFTRLKESETVAALADVARAARAAGCNVLAGCPTFSGRKRFNSLLVFDRRGREVFRYHKV